MTFFCINCFAELRSATETCPRCGAEQSRDVRDFAAKLRAALAHPVAEIRRRAIFLLGKKCVTEGVDDLVRVVESETDPFLVEETAGALGRIGGDQALYALCRVARDKSLLVRARAVAGLVRAGGDWETKGFDLARNDPSAMVRESAGRH
jgi:HEAT repeat protein